MHYLFQDLTILQQISVSNSLLQFGNRMLYYLAFTTGAVQWKFSECLGVNFGTDSSTYWWKLPGCIIMFRVIPWNGNLLAPFFIPHSFTLNTEAFIKYLADVTCPKLRGWLVEDTPSSNRAPCYTSGKTHSWL